MHMTVYIESSECMSVGHRPLTGPMVPTDWPPAVDWRPRLCCLPLQTAGPAAAAVALYIPEQLRGGTAWSADRHAVSNTNPANRTDYIPERKGPPCNLSIFFIDMQCWTCRCNGQRRPGVVHGPPCRTIAGTGDGPPVPSGWLVTDRWSRGGVVRRRAPVHTVGASCAAPSSGLPAGSGVVVYRRQWLSCGINPSTRPTSHAPLSYRPPPRRPSAVTADRLS